MKHEKINNRILPFLVGIAVLTIIIAVGCLVLDAQNEKINNLCEEKNWSGIIRGRGITVNCSQQMQRIKAPRPDYSFAYKYLPFFAFIIVASLLFFLIPGPFGGYELE